MRTIQEKQDRIIRAFQSLGDWQDRYRYIIDLGRKMESLDEDDKREENLVRGCQSQVWLVSELVDGKVVFHADSDAAITKGLVALLLKIYSEEEPGNIINTPPEFIEKIGMQEHLSPTRSNGLVSMVKQMKIYAMAYKSKMSERQDV